MTLSVLSLAGDRGALVAAVRPEGSATAVLLQGEADIASRSVIVDVLTEVIANGGGDVVVDLGGLAFIDSGSVRCLQVARQLLDRQGRSLNVRSPSPAATRILELLGLSELIGPAR
jgi:anti-anti-sigma factor